MHGNKDLHDGRHLTCGVYLTVVDALLETKNDRTIFISMMTYYVEYIFIYYNNEIVITLRLVFT